MHEIERLAAIAGSTSGVSDSPSGAVAPAMTDDVDSGAVGDLGTTKKHELPNPHQPSASYTPPMTRR